ncbi:MAG: hypothetical protein AABY53_00755 [Bdellovibrionota bacterium]
MKKLIVILMSFAFLSSCAHHYKNCSHESTKCASCKDAGAKHECASCKDEKK